MRPPVGRSRRMPAVRRGGERCDVPVETGGTRTPHAACFPAAAPDADSGGAGAMTVHLALVLPAIFEPRMTSVMRGSSFGGGLFSVKRFASRAIRPVVSRQGRVFSVCFGPGGVLPPPRVQPFAKARRSSCSSDPRRCGSGSGSGRSGSPRRQRPSAWRGRARRPAG